MINMKELFVITITNIFLKSISDRLLEFGGGVVGMSRFSIWSSTRFEMKLKFR